MSRKQEPKDDDDQVERIARSTRPVFVDHDELVRRMQEKERTIVIDAPARPARELPPPRQ